jgi:hypothetical protein
MAMMADTEKAADAPIATVRLTLKDEAELEAVDSPLHQDLSAVARCGDTLFVASDETAGVDRLEPAGDGHWAGHRHVSLADMFDLPDGPDGEMDIEGLAVDDGWLWVVGSHSLKRDKPKRDKYGHAAALMRMTEIDRDPNRYFLGRVPLKEVGPGRFEPVAATDGRVAQSLKLKKSSSKLIDWLSGDPHLAPFLSIPSKENGFDIEGLAARGDRVWLGLRGPVLRGHCVVLELDLKVDSKGRLKARKIDGDHRYRKYLLDGYGLGIRDLCFDDDDLLVLLGPTLSADGPAHILRWEDAANDTVSGVIDPSRARHVVELPYRGPHDHPEGIEPWPEGGAGAMLVVYDAPMADRVEAATNTLQCDVFRVK